MLSSIDAALEASAAIAPRVTAFQPKVKPRGRKGALPSAAEPARKLQRTGYAGSSTLSPPSSEPTSEASGAHLAEITVASWGRYSGNAVELPAGIDDPAIGEKNPVILDSVLEEGRGRVEGAPPAVSAIPAQPSSLTELQESDQQHSSDPFLLRQQFEPPPAAAGMGTAPEATPVQNFLNSSLCSMHPDTLEGPATQTSQVGAPSAADVANAHPGGACDWALVPHVNTASMAGQPLAASAQVPVAGVAIAADLPIAPARQQAADKRPARSALPGPMLPGGADVAALLGQPPERKKYARKLPHGSKRGRKAALGEWTANKETRAGGERDDVVPPEGQTPQPRTPTLRDIIRQAEAAEKKREREETARKLQEGIPIERSNGPRPGPRGIGGTPAEDTSRLALAPQVQVIDGRIVINESSLTAAATAPSEALGYLRVEESAARLNSGSYANWTKGEKWTVADTDMWYKALRQFGTDFGLIQRLFPGRNRRQIKNKFRIEDKANPRRVSAALNHRCDDHSHYEEMLNGLKAPAEIVGAEEADVANAKEPMAHAEAKSDLASEPAASGSELASGTYTDACPVATGTKSQGPPNPSATKLTPRRAAAGRRQGFGNDGDLPVDKDPALFSSSDKGVADASGVNSTHLGLLGASSQQSDIMGAEDDVLAPVKRGPLGYY